ncbi:MAG TPA: EAL domain-containing protein [Acidisoma sp.]|uniref:EAL domain-containing protein n=1 Tax=Acidisoma sp. TaxID=1872115 RepID=UPI002C284C11|nr:EAL domain-containing protein [Acidisoma sp.]HTI02440.1 EAL domain-containing protein [Acidisoma sp.]
MTLPAQTTPEQRPDPSLRVCGKTETLLTGLLLAGLVILILALELGRDITSPLLPPHVLGSAVISVIIVVLLILWRTVALLRRAQSAIAGRMRAQQELEHLAFRDWQTGLPNRYAFEQRLPDALIQAEVEGRAVAVGVIDLDDFKTFNDVHGLTAGDRLLQDVAVRLRETLPSGQFVGRLGADEFVLILDLPDDGQTLAAAEAVLRQLETGFAEPFLAPGGVEMTVGMSLGLALYPQDAANRDGLLRTAFVALNEIKAKKLTRTTWWHIAGQPMAERDPAMAAAPYGETSRELLGQLGAAIAHAIEAEMPRLVGLLSGMEQSHRILTMMAAAETASLATSLRNHFVFLAQPDLTETAHRVRSLKVGTVHGVVGLPSADTFRMLEQFGAMLRRTVDRAPLTAVQRLQAQTVLQARLANELQFEQQGRWQIDIERQQAIARIQQGAGAWFAAGTFPGELVQTLSTLCGIHGAAWGRPNDHNLHVVEFSAGCALNVFMDLEARGIALCFGTQEVHLEPCTLRAWGTGQIEVTNNIALDPRMAAMVPTAQLFSVRSAAAVPVRDDSGLPVAILTLFGAYPGQFSNQHASIWLWALQEIVQRGSGVATATQAPISVERRRSLRNALYGDGLRMEMQPLIDLRSGRLSMVEALARITLEGQSLPPPEFLSAYGSLELQHLFRRGLHQSLDFLAQTADRLPGLGLGVNLPPAVLEAEGCTDWITEALDRFGIAPDRLYLELLELGDTRNWKDQATSALRDLSNRGVHLVMDDLGSGYSGLQRLRTLPFDKVKIDQNLIHQALTDPQSTIPFIGGLIQVAHRLGMTVVAEGLERPDLIEMVAFLGADYGQGFSLARPMPCEAVADWAAGFVYAVNPARPQTALGARALREREKDGSLAPLA